MRMGASSFLILLISYCTVPVVYPPAERAGTHYGSPSFKPAIDYLIKLEGVPAGETFDWSDDDEDYEPEEAGGEKGGEGLGIFDLGRFGEIGVHACMEHSSHADVCQDMCGRVA
tara:strand:- start:97 stop:438 length:342 start_codon:yes stop_codon:yes gene_type:complete